MSTNAAKIYFTDFFAVTPEVLEGYGAFNISLINDLPLFIDPFLLFDGEKPEYQSLHEQIIRYVKFLRDVSAENGINKGLLDSWYRFPEVKQNWLGLPLGDFHIENHAAYVGSWLEALKKDKTEIFKAAAGAQHICDWLNGHAVVPEHKAEAAAEVQPIAANDAAPVSDEVPKKRRAGMRM